jgi:cardiolipin synthase
VAQPPVGPEGGRGADGDTDPERAGRDTARERMERAREAGRERVEQAREAGRERVERARLTTRRLLGLDRSGPPPPETLAGQPLHVWTIPNAIGFLRAALIPVFLVLALSSQHGTDALPAVLFALIAWSDYADGMAARITGQYSRFGALLDPIVDRALVIAGVVVCWKFELLPRWALAVLIGRELFMLAAGRFWITHGLELKINWWGRLAVWPTMTAIQCGLVNLPNAGRWFLYVGVAMSLVATVEYLRSGIAQLRARRTNAPRPSSSA